MHISPKQWSLMRLQSRQDFLLQTVCEWQALFEACHGRASRISFDLAWQLAEYLMDQVDDLPQPREQGALYVLVHTVLSAAEKGATPEQLRSGVAAYCLAQPSDEAGLILLETICDLPSPTRAS